MDAYADNRISQFERCECDHNQCNAGCSWCGFDEETLVNVSDTIAEYDALGDNQNGGYCAGEGAGYHVKGGIMWVVCGGAASHLCRDMYGIGLLDCDIPGFDAVNPVYDCKGGAE